MSSTFCWFALTVRPNHEQTAARGLSVQGFESYVPMYRSRRCWSDRIRETNAVLFPGYVFCRFGYPDRMRVLQSPSIRSIAGESRVRGPAADPLTVADDEIAALRALVASGHPVSPWPYMSIGQNVVIEHGPFENIRGVILREKNSLRVVVSVEALGASVAVEVDREMLAPDPARRFSIAS